MAPLGRTIEIVTSAGVLHQAVPNTILRTSSGTDVAITLPSGQKRGQRKVIVMDTKGSTGNFVLTPGSRNGYATITFNTVGDSVELVWLLGKWSILSNNGATVA